MGVISLPAGGDVVGPRLPAPVLVPAAPGRLTSGGEKVTGACNAAWRSLSPTTTTPNLLLADFTHAAQSKGTNVSPDRTPPF